MSMNYNRIYDLGPPGAWHIALMITQIDIHVHNCICKHNYKMKNEDTEINVNLTDFYFFQKGSK